MGIAEAALNRLASSSQDEGSSADPSPLREAIREAWDAVKADDADAFTEALEAAIDIKAAE